MDYGLWFLIYGVRIKPERKCVGFRFMLGLLFGGLSQCYRIIPVLMSWSVSGFIINFIIESVLMIFNIKFGFDGL